MREVAQMPRDERKRQKALMKKRSKQKVVAQHTAQLRASTPTSSQAIIRRARDYPLLECRISENWQKENDMGLIEVLVARKQPDGDVCFGLYLIDKYCLGLKNTLAKVGVPLADYRREVRNTIFHGAKPKDCSPELAHQMIYSAIDYAAQFGFEPEKDWALTQYLLVPRGELEEPYRLTFGKDGKPFFIAGPYDNSQRIIRQLEKAVGQGNYHYIMPIGEF
jgi:hypothetical protein